MIASFEHVPSGEWLTLHHTGAPRIALREMLDSHPEIVGPDWQCRSISTPRTVYGTLQGGNFGTAGDDKPITMIGLNGERYALGYLRRDDLLPERDPKSIRDSERERVRRPEEFA